MEVEILSPNANVCESTLHIIIGNAISSGTMMLPLSRFRATSHIASIWPVLAGDIAYFRCLSITFETRTIKGKVGASSVSTA